MGRVESVCRADIMQRVKTAERLAEIGCLWSSHEL